MRILIVEDEVHLAEALGQILKEQKYIVDVVNDGEQGLFYALNSEYEVIILDIMLPKISGYEVIKKLRDEKISTPVILLTARDDIKDKVKGLDYGADDYMTKPFSTDELLARVRALSRRQGEVILDELEYNDIRLNVSTNTLFCGKKSVHLGFKEFEVLKILMTNPNVIVAKESLIAKVWGIDSDVEDNNVEAYISFLRKKINFIGSECSIKTVRKVGYILQGVSDD